MRKKKTKHCWWGGALAPCLLLLEYTFLLLLEEKKKRRKKNEKYIKHWKIVKSEAIPSGGGDVLRSSPSALLSFSTSEYLYYMFVTAMCLVSTTVRNYYCTLPVSAGW